MEQFRITVVTVCFNAAQTIKETIISVINQTYTNIEYVIIDGKSNDDTISIIQRYSKEYFKVISEPDKGIYDAMNKALNIASGDFIIFLGADDHFISYNTLLNVVKFLKKPDVVYYGNVLRPNQGDLYCGKFNKWKIAIKNIPHQALFYPKSVYKKYNYDIRYKLLADYVYNLNLYGMYKFSYIPEVIAYFQDDGASFVTKDVEFKKDYGKIVSNNLGLMQNIYSSVYHFLRNLLKGEKMKLPKNVQV